MNTDVKALRQLWQDVFGDSEEFLDAFFGTAYAPERCRTRVCDGKLAAAVYWFDCTIDGRRAAYIYALATAPEYRGRGYAHALMAQIREELSRAGYGAILLVPGTESLFRFYEGMGYRAFGPVRSSFCQAGSDPVPLREVRVEEYARLRRKLLPPGGVVQEGENLGFLASVAELYAGEDFLLACVREGETLQGLELLGNETKAPGIVKALGCREGSFRIPGGEDSLAMFLPLAQEIAPTYLGLAFD